MGQMVRSSLESHRLNQVGISNHAGVMHLTVAAALCNLLPQIRQPDIGPVPLDQILFSILASATALVARQAYQIAGVFVKQ